MAVLLWARREEIQFEDQVVGIIESRDGTIMDVVRKSKPYTFDE